jgi:hypothetical protein
MKPGDHPEFFRFPAPEGRSRESTIRVDRSGTWHHEGEVVEHPRLKRAMQSWVRRHPDDGRFILSNGYDWTYFTVEDTPFFVESLRIEPSGVTLLLDDGTEEPWDPATSRVGDGDALYATVKRTAEGGPFEARFTRHAQIALAPLLCFGDDGGVSVQVGETATRLGKSARP